MAHPVTHPSDLAVAAPPAPPDTAPADVEPFGPEPDDLTPIDLPPGMTPCPECDGTGTRGRRRVENCLECDGLGEVTFG